MATTGDLKDKVVLITGAARRVGATVARLLHANGARLAIHYRNSAGDAGVLQKELNAARKDSVVLVRGDLLDTAALPQLVADTVQAFGRLDALINNASSFYATPIGSATEAQWDDLIGSNLKGPFFLAQAAAPHLIAAHGCIVNTVDIYGEWPLKNYPIYSVAKAGLAMLTKSLARELGPNVRVNAIAPGTILWPEHGLSEEVKENIISRTPAKRSGEPADVARTTLFLVRDAGYITGQIIAVDGGRSIVL